MADSLFFWGVAKRYSYGAAIAAVNWNGISEKKRKAIDKATSNLAKKIKNNSGKVKPGLRTKGFFAISRMLQKQGFNQSDVDYWKEKGWTGNKRPW